MVTAVEKQVQLIVVAAMFLGAWSSGFPSNYQKCSRKSADFDKCLGRAIEDALGQFTKPRSDLSVPNMEPLLIPEMSIGAGTGAVGLVQNYKNVHIHGYSKFKVRNVKLDFQNKTLEILCFSNNYWMDAEYDMTGKILLLPVSGKGKCSLALIDVVIKAHFKFDIVEKNGRKHLKFTAHWLDFEPKLAKYHFGHLFDGNKQLGENINKVMNDNWRAIYDDVIQGYQQAFAVVHMGIANSIFSKFAVDDIFDN